MSEEWFARRTYRWDDWTLPQLQALKEAGTAGTRVSLVVPARNEAATVGDVVTRVRTALTETVALLDEIVVIDSDSTDDTYDVATDAGATAYRSAEIRPDLGTRPGKGEAMWKSLFVTSGDLLVFMDADLLDWDTHFVPGLLGPLLTEPGTRLVKGFYERPYGEHDTVALEGGRVTELVARPLLALCFPELAGVVQPLAGEWAVRREVFTRLSVPTGYAVELAALLDVARGWGLEALAQVDLGRRAHRHQALRDLGGMATQLLAAGMERAGAAEPGRTAVEAGLVAAESGGVAAGSDLASAETVTLLRQYALAAGVPTPHDRAVDTGERPPAVQVADPTAPGAGPARVR